MLDTKVELYRKIEIYWNFLYRNTHDWTLLPVNLKADVLRVFANKEAINIKRLKTNYFQKQIELLPIAFLCKVYCLCNF